MLIDERVNLSLEIVARWLSSGKFTLVDRSTDSSDCRGFTFKQMYNLLGFVCHLRYQSIFARLILCNCRLAWVVLG